MLAPVAIGHGAGGMGPTAWLPIPAGQAHQYARSSMRQAANAHAFAAIKADGSVYTWGDDHTGGAWFTIEHWLDGTTQRAVQVASNKRAFAAVTASGFVIAWGDPLYGGGNDPGDGIGHPVDIAGTSGVTQVASTDSAFAAVNGDGSVVAWGDVTSGGRVECVVGDGWCSPAPAGALSSGVARVYANAGAFAALKTDGSVVTWGLADGGGDSSAVAAQLTGGVTGVFATSGAFAALKTDGSVVTWGLPREAGDPSCTADPSGAFPNHCIAAPIASLSGGVTEVFGSNSAFAARKADGSVITWGDTWYGADSASVASQLADGVVAITPDLAAFAARKADGSVVVWGGAGYGGDASSVAGPLAGGVADVFANRAAFAALKDDGSVVTWGNDGGDSSAVAPALTSGVTQVFPNEVAFAALKSDGSVVTWGDGTRGGDSSAVAADLAGGVTRVFATEYAFAALKSDGSVVTWGDAGDGGTAGYGAAQLTSGVETIASPLYRPAYLPGAPTDVRVTPPAPGARTVVVAFAPPASDGGGPITSATATCTSSTGGATVVGTDVARGRRDVTVDGLTLGATYTCTVAVANAAGTGPASEPSAPFATSAVPAPSDEPASTTATTLPIRVTRCTSARPCTSSGPVPDSATRVVQVATGSNSQMSRLAFGAHATARVSTNCPITTRGSSRTYTCRVRLSAGRWTLTTQALDGATVIAQSVTRMRVRAATRIAVTG